MAKIAMSPPWIAYYHEIEAFFKEDPDVHVLFDEDACEIKLFVDDAAKGAALDQLLVHEKSFGEITLLVTVIPANGVKTIREDLYGAALKDNPALSYIRTVGGIFSNPLTYVVFANKVVQYWTDNLGDINGLRSTLYQEIAKDIFDEKETVFFCTDLPRALQSVKWP